MQSSAVISSCRRYRYRLERRWGDGPALGWVMLNPSTADAHVDDPTIRKCVGFARRMGFSAIVVGNLFAYRATDPDHLLATPDPIGPENDAFLQRLAAELPRIICAWGVVHARLVPRTVEVKLLVPHAEPLAWTKGGHPRHPLYLPYPK